VPRPLWIGVATIVMVVIAVGLRFGLPIYRQRLAIREIERLGGVVETQDGGPELLRGWIGDSRMSIFDRVICVRFQGGGQVPDAGLAELKWLANPEGIEVLLFGDDVSDDSLRHFESMVGLKSLGLGGAQVSDAGLVHLKSLKNLQSLNLSGTQVTDAGLQDLKGFRMLRSLHLGYTELTDDGLEQLADIVTLEDLDLMDTRVTDAGLAHLQRLPNLKTLWLNFTATTDVGLTQLSPITSLRNLNLFRTRVTASGVSELQRAIPLVQIHNWKSEAGQ